MEKTHCDCCDAVIGPKAKRLILKAGVATGDGFHEDEEFRDFCLLCVKERAEKIMREIVSDWEL